MSADDDSCSVRDHTRIHCNGLSFNDRGSGCCDPVCFVTADFTCTVICNRKIAKICAVHLFCRIDCSDSTTCNSIMIVQDPGCPYCIFVINSSVNDSHIFICCFDRLSISGIHHNMIYITVLCIEDQVSRLCVFYWNLGSILALILGNTRKIISVSLVNLLYKSGTVCSVCQTGSAPHIRITDKLGCIFNH